MLKGGNRFIDFFLISYSMINPHTLEPSSHAPWIVIFEAYSTSCRSWTDRRQDIRAE